MGIPGAGKSRIAEEYAARGYLRLNRDERGARSATLAEALDEELAAGARRVVLDNTYLTRAARNDVVEAAARHGVPARCIWVDTPLAQAQVNLVERLLERFGALPTPGSCGSCGRSRACSRRPRRCACSASSSRRRTTKVSPPSSRCRSHARPSSGGPGVFVAARGAGGAGLEGRDRAGRRGRAAPGLRLEPGRRLRTGWTRPRRRLRPRSRARSRPRLCPHPAGPPTCWCRPPLPGLPLAFAREHGVDPARSVLIGSGAGPQDARDDARRPLRAEPSLTRP